MWAPSSRTQTSRWGFLLYWELCDPAGEENLYDDEKWASRGENLVSDFMGLIRRVEGKNDVVGVKCRGWEMIDLRHGFEF
jgi:hypothetical protein